MMIYPKRLDRASGFTVSWCLFGLVLLSLHADAQAGQILDFQRLSDTQARLRLSRDTNQTFTILSGTNLLEWNPVALEAPVSEDEDSVTHELSLPPEGKQAFYRVVYHEPSPVPVPLEVLDGPPAGALIDYLPAMGVPLVDASEVTFVKEGLPISLAHILATLKDTTTVQDLNTLLAAENLVLAGAIPRMKLLVLRRQEVTTLQDLDASMERVRQAGVFKTVVDDFGMEIPDPMPAPPEMVAELAQSQAPNIRWAWDEVDLGKGLGGNNHFEMSRIPQLWNWLDYGHRQKEFLGGHEVAVFESAFYDHSEFEENVILDYSQNPNLGTNVYNHGAAVLGVIAARHDTRGIQGVTPLADRVVGHAFPAFQLNAQAIIAAFASSIMRQVESVMTNDAVKPKVLNMSCGIKWIRWGIGNPTNAVRQGSQTWAQWMDQQGKLWSEVFQALNESIADPNYLLVATAGNESGLDARYNSPMANVASRPQDVGTNAPQFLLVESVDQDRVPSSFTNWDHNQTGDAVSAGGDLVTVLRGPGFNTYNPFGSGTSYSAPLVTGLASFLWNLDPSLTTAEMKTLLKGPDTTFTVLGGARANLVDGYAAALAIDSLRMNHEMHKALVDVDDGTLDGNLRMKALESEEDPDEIRNFDGRRGDGLVNMKDFRAFRDAWLDVSGRSNHLDGARYHYKRDLNFDGLIGTQAVSPPHPEPYQIGSRVDPVALPEKAFARYDFNGNGRLDPETGTYNPPTNAVAPFKRDPDTPLTGRNQGAGLLRDLDVLVHPAVWSLDEENMALSGAEPDLNLYSDFPPEDWTTNVLYDFTFYGNQMPYLWSFDLHIDMEGGNPTHGATIPERFLGELIVDGLWIDSFFRTSKARLGDWQGVVTIPFVDPTDLVGSSSPTNFPWVTIYYKKTQGNEYHQYMFSLRPEAGEDIALSVGWDKLKVKSTSRDRIVGLNEDLSIPHTEKILKDPGEAAYGTIFVPWDRYTNRVDNIVNPARQIAIGSLGSRLRSPVAFDLSPDLEPIFTETSDELGILIEVYGLEAIYEP